ncbi:E4 orf3 [Simian adenovirus 20]|uniref:E4 ORF3 n=1 Tax=Simian adenovirus 20 TaxID=585059 RepID=F6KSW4_9ADEN|nr:E4 ORF3 [Simian adenovirus 20]AEF59069.1 E4 orf3 [Simian adenovirus 20]
MRVCLRMLVESALSELFIMAGMELQGVMLQIIRDWKQENYLGLIDDCAAMIDPGENRAFVLLVFLNVRVRDLIPATVSDLENRLIFDLAVMFHQETQDRCHLRDLSFEVLHDQLE